MDGFALCDEVVAERVHEVKNARGAVGLPPFGGEDIEVSDFIWRDGRVLATVRRREIALRNSWCFAKCLGKLSCGGGEGGRSHGVRRRERPRYAQISGQEGNYRLDFGTISRCSRQVVARCRGSCAQHRQKGWQGCQ